MSPGWPPATTVQERFPRVSGDEPPETFRDSGKEAFSPRERG